MENIYPATVANLNRIEWNNEPVLTTAQLADKYETSTETLRHNFNNNRERFIEGKHFFKLEGEDLTSFGKIFPEATSKFSPVLYLWTDDDDNAFDETVWSTGELWDYAGGRFYRLDKAAYITRHYLARLWNGENETNDRIKKGWAFIRWFNAFLPTFFKDNVKYWCGGQYPNYNFEEPTQYAPITHDERNFIADFLAKSRTAFNNLAETLNLEAE